MNNEDEMVEALEIIMNNLTYQKKMQSKPRKAWENHMAVPISGLQPYSNYKDMFDDLKLYKCKSDKNNLYVHNEIVLFCAENGIRYFVSTEGLVMKDNDLAVVSLRF